MIGWRSAGVEVVPDRSGQGQHALGDADGDVLDALATMAFEIERAFESVVDRLEQLAHLLGVAVRRRGRARACGGAQQCVTVLGQVALEGAPGEPLSVISEIPACSMTSAASTSSIAAGTSRSPSCRVIDSNRTHVDYVSSEVMASRRRRLITVLSACVVAVVLVVWAAWTYLPRALGLCPFPVDPRAYEQQGCSLMQPGPGVTTFDQGLSWYRLPMPTDAQGVRFYIDPGAFNGGDAFFCASPTPRPRSPSSWRNSTPPSKTRAPRRCGTRSTAGNWSRGSSMTQADTRSMPTALRTTRTPAVAPSPSTRPRATRSSTSTPRAGDERTTASPAASIWHAFHAGQTFGRSLSCSGEANLTLRELRVVRSLGL